MYRLFSAIALSFLSSITCVAQQTSAAKDSVKVWRKPIAADCDNATPLDVFKKTSYGLTIAPNGFGAKQEIVTKMRNSNTAFEKEHHTAWYLLSMSFDGEIIFEIVPEGKSDDYDFILYQYNDSNFCTQLKSNKAVVLRSNIRRNDTSNKGVTGLSSSAVNMLQAQGPGEQFSKSLKVKNGEKYMLVLDNVYDNGMGHTIHFHYIKDININGVVVNDEDKKMKADITLSDEKGNIIANAQSSDSGNYSIRSTITENTNYNLTISANDAFVATETINTRLIKDKGATVNIKSVLPKLRKGKKYKIGNINFWGGSPEMLPESYPSANALCKLLKKNSKMIIEIEGHVNGIGWISTKEQLQDLSEQRALTLYNYLHNCGIKKERMSTVGLSDRFMLFPKGTTEEEYAANRRVEINVKSIDLGSPEK